MTVFVWSTTMAINWYPGHMHKAKQAMRTIMSQVDVVIEVLDARLPYSSENPMLSGIRGDKPCIKVLTKSDLADPVLTQQWQHTFEQVATMKAIVVSAKNPSNIKDLLTLCHQLSPHNAKQTQQLNAMIMGIPNVGKSTLINHLAGKSIAKTGNEPAVTKQQQRIKLPRAITLIDTPGVLWPKFDNQNNGYRLGITGAIKDTAISHDDMAIYAIEYLRDHYASRLMARYQLPGLVGESEAILQQIGQYRGCISAGGMVDITRAASILLNEIRDGKLGQITFETPEMMHNERVVTERAIAALAEKKAAKKATRRRRK